MAGARTRGPAPSGTAETKHRLEAVPDAAMGIRQLHQVLDASPESVVCIDQSWYCTFVNQAARTILKADDLIGANLWTRFPLNQKEPFASNYRATMEQRIPTDFEAYYPEPLDVWFKVSARPYDGGIIIFSSDITEHKRGEKEKRVIAQEVQAFFDAAPDSVLGMDRNWTITFCNKAARERATPEEILGTSLWTRFPVSVEEPYLSHYHRTMQERVTSDFEAFVPEPYNLWLKVIARPFGEGIMVLYSDITDRKQAEALRDASVRQLEQVLEATTDGVVSLDRNFNYTLLNRQAELLLGRNDLLGKNMWEEFPSTEADTPLRRTMEDRIARTFEVFNPAPLNRWFDVQARPSDGGIVVFFSDITEDRATQQTLLARQATLAFVQQTALVATWVVDLGTGAMTVMEGSSPVFGLPNEQIQTTADFRRTVHPEDLPVVLKRTHDVIATGGLATVDYRVVAVDGSVRWLEGRAVVEHNEGGVATHLRGMTTDITARKLDEQRLRASEERYRVLADLNPQTLWIGEPDGAISYTNQGHAEYRGVEPEDLLGSSWLDGIYPADREAMSKAWSRSVATGEEYGIESRIRNAKGAFRWWALRALPVRDEAGKILNWLGVAHDIHDMKMVAEQLRRKQEETERQRVELEAIYENAPIGLALFDPIEFRWLRLNETQAEIFGMKKQELLHTRLFDTVKIPGVREMFEQVASGVPVLDQLVEGELPNRPGEARMWRVSYLPIFAPDGSVQAITASSLEITREKKAEAALIQSEKLAAVGRLASSISHEINNPLEAITNLLYLVATDEHLHETVKVYVQMAQSELTRVSQITTQTLRFHRQAVNQTLITPKELVGSVLGLYQGRLGNSHIRVEATYASATSILCFENDLRQVLNNLIANAIDAMRKGGRLVVRAHKVTDWGLPRSRTVARRGIRITVADTGHGMPPAVMARVFEPFYTTKDLNGTGLGLWISAGIVQNHGGRLTVRSSQHAGHTGTVFTLFLPLGN